MGIPEHDKCVKMWKDIRRSNHEWKKKKRPKKRKRIRELLRAERMMHDSILREQFKGRSYMEIMRDILLGKHYRRWGKYDD